MLIAHQGGWDELLIIAIPLLLYGGIRMWERYRGPDEPAGRPAGEGPEGADPE